MARRHAGDLADGPYERLGDIAAAAEAWTPERAAAHQARARAAVDWRWRLVDLCRALGWDDAQARAVAATRLLATSDC